MPGARLGRPPIRPGVDDADAVQALCNHLVAGMGMHEVCTHPECPAERLVYLKMAADPAFRSVIARAREAQQHAIIDETVRMADAATVEDWQVVRLRIWARQWRAAQLAPQGYGDKGETEHTRAGTRQQGGVDRPPRGNPAGGVGRGRGGARGP